ncbi:TniQ family protein [Shinella sp.]|uniref:TniQ family protein n=1 Tax=Shinella sp. TaxID=1870904 RepID=UPI00289E61AC|nr:TniQ family protein [Shinella sp.]
MTRLAELLPFNPGEYVGSYCSRLAAACGYSNARALATRLGFRFQGLATGDDVDVRRFASALGTAQSQLVAGTVVTRNRYSTISGERFSPSMMHRLHLRVCPQCIIEDELTAEGRRGFRSYGRLEWMVAPVQACRAHNCMIFVLKSQMPHYFLEHDFAAKLAIHREQIPMIARAAAYMEPDAYQGYVEGRLRSGPNGSRWLDAYPMHVVGRVCEAVGFVEHHGVSAGLTSLGPGELSRCAGRGYDIIQGGEVDFTEFLERLIGRFFKAGSDMKGRGLYGHLHTVLATASPEAAYEPLRKIMREVTTNSVPLAPGADCLGPITERRMHSVCSASKKFGLQPKRLRNLLVRSGKVEPDAAGRSYHRIVLDATEMEAFAKEVRDSLSFKETVANLGAERSQLASIVECGILRSFENSISGGAAPESGGGLTTTMSFRASDVAEIRRRIECLSAVSPSDHFVRLRSAVKMANCKHGEVVRLILDGELKNVAKIDNGEGLAALRIDPYELREWTRGPDHGCHSLREVELAIPASNAVVHALIEADHLKSVRRRNPWKRHMQMVVEPDELARFISTFVSLGTLAHRHRRTTAGIERRLRKVGIVPAFIASGKKFYRVLDVAAFSF